MQQIGQLRDIGNVKDLLLCEPFSVERVAAALGIIRNDYLQGAFKGFDLRYPERLDDLPIIAEYAHEVNAAVRGEVLSYNKDRGIPQDGGLRVQRVMHAGLSDLLTTRAKRIERGRGWMGCLRVRMLDAFDAFKVPDGIEKDFERKIDAARPGLFGLTEGWDAEGRRTLSLRLYDIWYPDVHRGPQDTYVRYA